MRTGEILKAGDGVARQAWSRGVPFGIPGLALGILIGTVVTRCDLRSTLYAVALAAGALWAWFYFLGGAAEKIARERYSITLDRSAAQVLTWQMFITSVFVQLSNWVLIVLLLIKVPPVLVRMLPELGWVSILPYLIVALLVVCQQTATSWACGWPFSKALEKAQRLGPASEIRGHNTEKA